MVQIKKKKRSCCTALILPRFFWLLAFDDKTQEGCHRWGTVQGLYSISEHAKLFDKNKSHSSRIKRTDINAFSTFPGSIYITGERLTLAINYNGKLGPESLSSLLKPENNLI